MFSVDESGQPFHDDGKEGVQSIVDCVFVFFHKDLQAEGGAVNARRIRCRGGQCPTYESSFHALTPALSRRTARLSSPKSGRGGNASSGGLRPFDEDVGDFRAAEFVGGALAGLEHF